MLFIIMPHIQIFIFRNGVVNWKNWRNSMQIPTQIPVQCRENIIFMCHSKRVEILLRLEPAKDPLQVASLIHWLKSSN